MKLTCYRKKMGLKPPFGKCLGFTLIEVLLALSIIAIALTALLRATGENVSATTHVKEISIDHWVAMQAIAMIQLGLVSITPNQEITQVTTLFKTRRYWRAKLLSTPIKSMQEIIVTTSKTQSGPFGNKHIAYKRA